MDGIDAAILYHFRRTDDKHNFSAYFYPLHLLEADVLLSKYLGFAAFVPQAAAVFWAGTVHARDLPFAWFLQVSRCFCLLA